MRLREGVAAAIMPEDEEVAALFSGANVRRTAQVTRPQTRQRRPTRLPP